MDYINEIKKLKKAKNAIILAHNYQSPEIQDIADILGDSLDLSRAAAKVEADIIVFCGVHFMAETARILAPGKKVLIPRKDAGCPMADMINADQLREFKAQHPRAKVVTYVNSTAEVKAETDVCCTSANAVKVVQNIDAEEIIFAPDKNLGAYCQRFTKKKLHIWNGYCYVHSRMTPEEMIAAKTAHPDAKLLVHPECPPAVIDLADEVLSTSGMLSFVREDKSQKYLIATEEGIIYRMKRRSGKEFFTAGTAKACVNMKKTHLEDVYNALAMDQYEIKLADDIIKRAKVSLDNMLKYV